MRVLLIEDDFAIGQLLRSTLERDRHEVTITETGADGLHLLGSWKPDLVFLDLGLPDADGRDVLKKIRTVSDVPVIIVSARAEESDRILGLELGSDDYIVKPFSIPEVTARARALMRRMQPANPSSHDPLLTYGDLSMDVEERRLSKGGERVDLTNREFQVFRMLLEQPGKLVTRADLAHTIWGMPATAASRSIDVCISSIRRKLGDNSHEPRCIETVRGVGFRLLEASTE